MILLSIRRIIFEKSKWIYPLDGLFLARMTNEGSTPGEGGSLVSGENRRNTIEIEHISFNNWSQF